MSRSEAFAKTGRTAVQQNIQGTLEFLQKYPPFNQMDLAHLGFLVENCQLRFYSEGEKVICPEDGPVGFFYIVKQGTIYGERRQGQDSSQETTFEITTGECFPIAALLGERATRTSHIAAVDTFCLLLDKAAFIKLFSQSNPFRDFSVRGISSLLDQANQQVQSRAAETLGSQFSMETSLAALAMRQPVTCLGHFPLHKAVQLMHEQQVGSLVITDEMQRPQGIFTLRDLRRVIADANADLRQPISELMTLNPFYLTPQATAFDAALAMTERHIAHVCLVQDGRLVGVISERDLFSLQRVDLVHLARAVSQAASIEKLVQLRDEIRSLVDRMIAHGASPEQVTRLITLLNDHTVSRVIELCMEQHGDPGVEFTWLVFGSEGRKEQTLYTDQDNGILFEASSQEEANAIRQKLLPLAREINLALDDCGFTLCKGNIMAGNAELCLSRQEWSRRFNKIVREATAGNLLYSTIFFDLRAIWGPVEGCQVLRREMLSLIRGNDVFQRLMAQGALQHKPPLGGLFRDFSLDKKGVEKDTLDLKIKGLTPFVDGARVLALSHGIESSNTLERFRQLVNKGVIERLDGDAYAEAYHFIQLIRMQQHQQQARNELAYTNRIYPDELNHLDRRILREAFRQGQRLQSSIAFRYQL
jgi:CBS domain-containing protein